MNNKPDDAKCKEDGEYRSKKRKGTKKKNTEVKAEKPERARKKKKACSIGSVAESVDVKPLGRAQRANTLSGRAKERKIESAVRLWSSNSDICFEEEQDKVSKISEDSAFPGIPVFSEEDKNLEKRTEMRELFKIEQAFGSWAGETGKKRSSSFNLGAFKRLSMSGSQDKMRRSKK